MLWVSISKTYSKMSSVPIPRKMAVILNLVDIFYLRKHQVFVFINVRNIRDLEGRLPTLW